MAYALGSAASQWVVKQLVGTIVTDVFINCSSRDEHLATMVIDRLQSIGLSTWSSRQIPIGADVLVEIRKNLDSAKCVITLWTPNSIKSDWVLSEARAGYAKGTLLPILVGVEPDELPTPFALLHAINIGAQPTEADWLNLARSTEAHVSARTIKTDKSGSLSNEAVDPGIAIRVKTSGKKAFISYASDDEDIAVELVQQLEAGGCPCWIAFRDVDSGDDYRASIVSAIAETAFVVLLYSKNVNSSFDVANELLLARKKGKRRFCLKLDGSDPSGPVEYELASVQWIDCTANRSAGFERIVSRAKLL